MRPECSCHCVDARMHRELIIRIWLEYERSNGKAQLPVEYPNGESLAEEMFDV